MKKRADTLILFLDHSIGEIHREGMEILGIELWPEVHRQLERLSKLKMTLFLIIAEPVRKTVLAAVRNELPFLTILTGQSFQAVIAARSFTVSTDRVIFSSADRKNRQVASTGLKAEVVPHLTVANWLLEGKKVSFVRMLTNRLPDAASTDLGPYFVEKQGTNWFVLRLMTDEGIL